MRYLEPEMEVICLKADDVVRTSNPGIDQGPDPLPDDEF